MKTAFSNNMKKVRKAYGWSQVVAAKKLGIKVANLGAYEEGRGHPNLPRLEEIVNAYKINDIKSFLFDENFVVQESKIAV